MILILLSKIMVKLIYVAIQSYMISDKRVDRNGAKGTNKNILHRHKGASSFLNSIAVLYFYARELNCHTDKVKSKLCQIKITHRVMLMDRPEYRLKKQTLTCSADTSLFVCLL